MDTYVFTHLKIKVPWLGGLSAGVGWGAGQGLELEWPFRQRKKESVNFVRKVLFLKG